MQTNCSVTIILRAHNAEETIAQAIASTLNQSFADFELWVLENGSKDRTAEVARRFDDPRVRVFELGPVGQSGAIQYAIEKSSSEWLALMDADDLMLPNRLKVQMEVIRQIPNLVLVGTAYACVTPFGHVFERISLTPSGSVAQSRDVDISSMSRGRFFADGSAIFNRRIALEAGGIDPEFSYADLPLFFRLLARGKGWEIAEPLYLYRIQPRSMSRSKDFADEARRIRAKYAPHTLRHFVSQNGSNGAWDLISSLELLTGDRPVLQEIAGHLEKHGFVFEAKQLRWRSHLGQVGSAYYRWRSRRQYRYRPDWERLFEPVLKLDGQCVARQGIRR